MMNWNIGILKGEAFRMRMIVDQRDSMVLGLLKWEAFHNTVYC